MNFYYFYIYLCNKYSDQKPTTLAQELKLSKSTISNWKTRNTFPRDSTIAPIADYFGFTVEELKAEYEKFVGSKQEKTAPSEGDGLVEKLKYLRLTPGLLEKAVRFFELAQADPETAERFLSFAVQELESYQQTH